MRMCSILTTALMMFATACTLKAADEDKAKKDEATAAKEAIRTYINGLLESGKSDVYFREEKDMKDGQIVRLFVVGTSPISTTLGLEEGIEIAQERAEEAAKSAFIKFLGSKVTVKKTVNSQIIIMKEGEEGGGADNLKEQAKKVERRTKEFEETASNIVKGLKVAGSYQNAKDKKFVVVYRWEAKNVDAINAVNEKLNATKDKPPTKKDDAKEPAKGEAKKTEPSKVIPDKKIIIDD